MFWYNETLRSRILTWELYFLPFDVKYASTAAHSFFLNYNFRKRKFKTMFICLAIYLSLALTKSPNHFQGTIPWRKTVLLIVYIYSLKNLSSTPWQLQCSLCHHFIYLILLIPAAISKRNFNIHTLFVGISQWSWGRKLKSIRTFMIRWLLPNLFLIVILYVIFF